MTKHMIATFPFFKGHTRCYDGDHFMDVDAEYPLLSIVEIEYEESIAHKDIVTSHKLAEEALSVFTTLPEQEIHIVSAKQAIEIAKEVYGEELFICVDEEKHVDLIFALPKFTDALSKKFDFTVNDISLSSNGFLILK